MEEAQNIDMSVKLSDYKEIVKSFSELLMQENAALEKFDAEAVSALYERKSKTVIAYRSMVAFFIKNQDALAALEKAQKEELRDMSSKLEELIRENEKLLKTRMETSQNVMNTIVNVAKMTNNSNATSYGAQGRYSPLDNNKNALAVNRTL